MSSAASQMEESQATSGHGGQRSSLWSPLSTDIFLHLVEMHLPQLNDKQSRKSKVWNTIARKIIEQVSKFFACTVFYNQFCLFVF